MHVQNALLVGLSLGVCAGCRDDEREIDADASSLDAATDADADASSLDAATDANASSDARESADGEVVDSTADAGPAVTTLRVHYDTGFGNRIGVRGDSAELGLSWDEGIDCGWSEGNVWVCELAGGTSGAFEWKPLFNDATWAKGTNWRTEIGATIDVYPHFFREGGRLVTHTDVASSILGGSRTVVVYLPPSYDENHAKRYPLVLMHDGQNLFDPASAFAGVAWEIDAAMDSLSGSAGIAEAIVVGVENDSDRMWEYTPTPDASIADGGGADLYLRFLLEELRSFLDATYRTTGARVGLAGSSLGGLVTLYGCWTRPLDFDRCGVFSPSLWWDDGYLLDTIAADEATAVDKPLTIYLDSGDSGSTSDGMADTAAMRDALIAKGFVLGESLEYMLGVGHAHDETAWAARAPGALRFLLLDPDRVP